MTELDELSFKIGELTGKVEAIKNKLDGLCSKADTIDKRLTNYQVKNASKSGGISFLVSVIINVILSFVKLRL